MEFSSSTNSSQGDGVRGVEKILWRSLILTKGISMGWEAPNLITREVVEPFPSICPLSDF